MLAALILLAVMHRKHHFAVLGSHTDQCCTPHPEQRTGTAEENRCGYTGDIAGTDSGGQAGHQGLERADFTALGITFLTALPHQFEARANLAQRHEFQTQHEEQTGAENQHQHGRAPDHAIELIDQGVDEFHAHFLILVVNARWVAFACPIAG